MTDTFYEERPELNDWMLSDDELKAARHSALDRLGVRRPAAEKKAMSGLVQRLARSLDVPSEDLADRIPDDTIRRTKYPVNERKQPDGSILFEADPGIIEGPRSLVHR